jgi:tripartite-type tricarboxylate transporter receptor subunit TctC
MTGSFLLRSVVTFLFAACATVHASAQSFPQKLVRLVVPYSAGGASDLVARRVGEGLARIWKQPVVIENRAGANTVTGTDYVAKSPNDGYTLLWTSNAHVIVPSLQERLPYNWKADFSPIAQVALIPQVIIARDGLPVANVRELVALAKQKPDTITYGTSGSGSPGQLAGELLNEAAGIQLRHVPYKGSGPALNDLLGGHIDLMFNGIPASIPYIASGKLKALGVTTKARLPVISKVPTIAEQGYPEYEASTWNGLFAPTGTPAPLIEKIQRDVAAVLADKEITDWLSAQGLAPVGSTPVAFQRALVEEHARWERVIKRAGIKAE